MHLTYNVYLNAQRFIRICYIISKMEETNSKAIIC